MQAEFQRIQSTPVLAYGGSYGGFAADGLDACCAIRNAANNGWVLTLSLWDNTHSTWANAIFTATDLAGPWTYLTGSARNIIGDSGLYIATSGPHSGAYLFVYESTNFNQFNLDYTTDFNTWTNISTNTGPAPAAYNANGRFDPWVTWNPNTSLYELWFAAKDASNKRSVGLFTASDYTGTWTDAGMQFAEPAWSSSSGTGVLGTPNVLYVQGLSPGVWSRLIITDISMPKQRGSAMWLDLLANGTYICYGNCLGANALNAWEAYQVFDMAPVSITDRGDGRGKQLWALYIGDSAGGGVGTPGSELGIAYINPPSNASGGNPPLGGGVGGVVIGG